MTRRVITIDLSEAEYKQTFLALSGDEGPNLRDFRTRLRVATKLQGIWEAHGREGRGLDTRLPKRPRIEE